MGKALAAAGDVRRGSHLICSVTADASAAAGLATRGNLLFNSRAKNE